MNIEVGIQDGELIKKNNDNNNQEGESSIANEAKKICTLVFYYFLCDCIFLQNLFVCCMLDPV